jgi:hypothetical protein
MVVGTPADATGTPLGLPDVSDDDPACVTVPALPGVPDIDLEKFVNGEDADVCPGVSVTPGSTLIYEYKVTNTGTTVLVDIEVTDDKLGLIGTISRLDPGEVVSLLATATAPGSGERENLGMVVGTPADATGTPLGLPDVSDDDPACATIPLGGFGCTPGYWRQKGHLDSWPNPPFAPDTLFESVFGRDVLGDESPTLRQAVKFKGGGLKALMRHTVAALLNAASPDVSFDLTIAEVIAAFQAAFDSGDFGPTKDLFDDLNNQGCPLK